MKRTLLFLFVLAACEPSINEHHESEHDMGLPDTRERTYTTATPVDPNDMNAIQDSIIALAHKDGTFSVLPLPQVSTNLAFNGDISANPAGLYAGWKSSGAGVADWRISDLLREGLTLDGIAVWLRGDGAVDVTLSVYKHDYNGGAVTLLYTTTENNVSNVGVTFVNLNPGSTLAVDIDQFTHVWLRISYNAANAEIVNFIPIYSEN